MIFVPSAEGFTMWTLPCEVSGIPAHETFMFLSLVMIHGLHHPEGQSLYVVRFRWGMFSTGSGSGGSKSGSTVAVRPTGVEYFL